MPDQCPTPEILAAALRARQPGIGDVELAAHLTDCRACRAKLEELAGGTGWLEMRLGTGAPSLEPEPLQRAMRVLESHTGEAAPELSELEDLEFLLPADDPGILGRFGSYEVLARVGHGGMGVVLKARDPALNRVVALKVLPPALASRALSRARFIREGRAAAAVVHDHVVPIYAVDEWAGLPYIVMQFVHGRSLAERIRVTGPLRLEEVLRVGAQTAAGLEAAHAQGLIHRDVKPGNILLENSVERVKLTDFGLARAVEDVELTRTGELAGTPEFMAPEQAGDDTVDHRADLFSLGGVLFAMSTGRAPFQGKSLVAVVRKVCDEQVPPVHKLNALMPEWLGAIVSRLMAKAPADRFQSAREVRELLERRLAQVQQGAPPWPQGETPSHSIRRRRRLLLTAVAVVAVAALGFLLFPRNEPQRAPSPAAPPGPEQQGFTVRHEAGKLVGSYAGVEEAARAIPSGGVLELYWNGPRDLPQVTLPAHPITVRPGKGFHPVWVHAVHADSALVASAALTVEDIAFDLKAADGEVRNTRTGRPIYNPGPLPIRERLRTTPRSRPFGHGLISISNAPLRLSRCAVQFFEPSTRMNWNEVVGLSAIVLNGGGTCELENCVLLFFPAKAICCRPGASNPGGNDFDIRLNNCLVIASDIFWMDLPEDARVQLHLTRCTFQGPNLICLPKAGAGKAVTVVAESNIFGTGAIIWDETSVQRDQLTTAMRWKDRDNLFNPIFDFIVLGAAPRDLPRVTLAQWNQWWANPEAGSREVMVTFPRSGDVPDSAGAVEFAMKAYAISDVRVTDGGPPLPQDQWTRFGADTGSLGPPP